MKPYLTVTLGYLVFGVTWILASDHLAGAVAGSLQDLSYFQTLKGLTYVCLSALLIGWLTYGACRRQLDQQREKEAVFHKVIEGSHHILLNYLNQMQLVSLEAEKCPGFDSQILKLARDASAHAKAELQQLVEIETVTADHIDSVVYREIRKS
jgi:hypothetical protein